MAAGRSVYPSAAASRKNAQCPNGRDLATLRLVSSLEVIHQEQRIGAMGLGQSDRRALSGI